MFETTEQVFEMLHGAAIDALERMEAERDTMRARAEAAEAEVARLRAEMAQARTMCSGCKSVNTGNEGRWCATCIIDLFSDH